MEARTKLKYLLIATFGAVIIGYGSYQMRWLINGPSITIEAPLNGSSLTSPLVTVSGQANRVTKLFLNGEKLTPDHTGRFESQLLLATGYNIIQLNGEDRFGRQIGETLELILN